MFKLEQDEHYWKVGALKCVELGLREQHIQEKLASVSLGSINHEQLVLTQLKRERISKADLKAKIEIHAN